MSNCVRMLENFVVISTLGPGSSECYDGMSNSLCHEIEQSKLASSVLSPKKWIVSKFPAAWMCRRQYVLSQPIGKMSKLIC